MKILYIAELVGKPGIYCARKTLAPLKAATGADAVIVCADSATNGSGLGRRHAGFIRKLGVDIITLGDQCFYKKDLVADFSAVPYVLRPHNLGTISPGKGIRIFNVKAERNGASVPQKLAVVVLLGQTMLSKIHADNPYAMLRTLLEELRAQTPYIVLDFHAAATAEKRTLFAMADGFCGAVIGSHTRVATADAAVLPGGTAVITDAGRTGSQISVGGNEAASRIQEYLSGIPDWTRESWEGLETRGVLVELAEDGKANSIVPIRVPVANQPDFAQIHLDSDI
ncbi:MAG: YmdB family metallophosphoesterase [Spirochaetaceae bacterium]|jgi:metallophosphoesterase (TIGR00282 family)|nr:YmdB family metallophosphoesterase [Spirochaetaceae bacterium]